MSPAPPFPFPPVLLLSSGHILRFGAPRPVAAWLLVTLIVSFSSLPYEFSFACLLLLNEICSTTVMAPLITNVLFFDSAPYEACWDSAQEQQLLYCIEFHYVSGTDLTFLLCEMSASASFSFLREAPNPGKLLNTHGHSREFSPAPS